MLLQLAWFYHLQDCMLVKVILILAWGIRRLEEQQFGNFFISQVKFLSHLFHNLRLLPKLFCCLFDLFRCRLIGFCKLWGMLHKTIKIQHRLWNLLNLLLQSSHKNLILLLLLICVSSDPWEMVINFWRSSWYILDNFSKSIVRVSHQLKLFL